MVLGRADPLAADLDDLAAAERVIERPTADPVTGFEHEYGVSGGLDLARRRQPGQAGADDDHVGLARAIGGAGPARGNGRVGRPGGAAQRGGAGRGGRAPEQLPATDLRVFALVHTWLPLVRGEEHSGDDVRRLIRTWMDGPASAAWH